MKHYDQFDSPIGKLTLVATEQGLCQLSINQTPQSEQKICAQAQPNTASSHNLLIECKAQLQQFLVGNRQNFTLPLDMQGTAFQLQVWQALLQIPYGETRSYGQIAAQIGNPKAARAVGMAANANPIAIVVPCHRMVGSKGGLVGYSAGLALKAALLQLEQKP